MPAGVEMSDYPSGAFSRNGRQFVFVGGDTDFNHRAQFFEMLGTRALEGKVDVDYYGDMDHTFYWVEHRARITKRVTDWVAGRVARS